MLARTIRLRLTVCLFKLSQPAVNRTLAFTHSHIYAQTVMLWLTEQTKAQTHRRKRWRDKPSETLLETEWFVIAGVLHRSYIMCCWSFWRIFWEDEVTGRHTQRGLFRAGKATGGRHSSVALSESLAMRKLQCCWNFLSVWSTEVLTWIFKLSWMASHTQTALIQIHS